MSNILEEAEPQPLLDHMGEWQIPPGVDPSDEDMQLAEKMRRESGPHFDLMWTLLMQERAMKVPAKNGMVTSGTEEVEVWQPITYHKGELSRLYGNKRFLVEVVDMMSNKEIDEMLIWRVENETRSLRQYCPVKYGEMQFFARSPNRLGLTESYLQSEKFFQRFQPIVVDVAEEETPQFLECGKTSLHCIVQFVYIDKSFFQRMRRSMGRIHLSDNWRKRFMDGLLVPVLLSVTPDFLKCWDKNKSTYTDKTFKKYKKAIDSWHIISTYIDLQVKFLKDNCGLQQSAWDLLFAYPRFEKSATARQLGEKEICSACTGYPRRMSAYSVEFGVETSQQWTYDRVTFETKPLLKDFRPLDPLYWCSECVDKAMKIHRLMHFEHNLIQIKRNHVAQDRKAFPDAKLLPIPYDGNDIIMWIHNLDQHWKNKMFLDFQVTLAETEAIRCTRAS